METTQSNPPTTEPAEFTDSERRVWRLALNVDAARQLHAIGVDLVNLGDGRVLLDLASDWLKLGMTLWVLCEEQADRLKVSEQAFGRLLDEPTLAKAAKALEGAIVNFTPPARRKTVKAIVRRVHDVLNKADDEGAAIADSDEALAMITKQLQAAADEAKKQLMAGG
ncbi:MAG: hypothetical protein AAGF31_03340 [Planctomycetota bacterium]